MENFRKIRNGNIERAGKIIFEKLLGSERRNKKSEDENFPKKEGAKIQRKE